MGIDSGGKTPAGNQHETSRFRTQLRTETAQPTQEKRV